MLERLPQYEYRMTETKNLHALARQCLSKIDPAFAQGQYEASIVSPLVLKNRILVMRYDSTTSRQPRFGVVVCRNNPPESPEDCSLLASTEDFNALLASEGICITTMDMALAVARLYIRCLSFGHPYRCGCFFLEELPVRTEAADFRGGTADADRPPPENFLFSKKRGSHWLSCKDGLACYASGVPTDWHDDYPYVRIRQDGGYVVILTTAGARDVSATDYFSCPRATRGQIMLQRWELVVREKEVYAARVVDISKRLKRSKGCMDALF